MQPKNAHALNNSWKRQDTTQHLIVCFSGVMPNPAHALTVRVADSKGYLGDYDATLQGNRFVIDTGQFADFPVGHYILEIWETYSKDGKAETGIYPNPDSFVTFDINANVVDDDLVKAFDLDDMEADHINAFSLGADGWNSSNNLQMLCRSYNRQKSNKTATLDVPIAKEGV